MDIVLTYTAPGGKTLDLANNSAFILSGVDGMTNAGVSLSTSFVATADGDILNNTRTLPRSIKLYFTIKDGENVEDVKRNIFEVIKPKQNGQLFWKQNGREIVIYGVVEGIEMARFSRGVVMQISMYCNQPYWEDAEYIIRQIKFVTAKHHFILTIPQETGIVFGEILSNSTRIFTNEGDTEIGADIHAYINGDVINPVLTRADGQFFGVNDTLYAGDIIEIVTTKGQKSVTKNGVSIFDKVKPGSTWLQLNTGDNIFTISADSGAQNLLFDFKFKQRYV